MKILCINTAFSVASLALKTEKGEDFLTLDANAKSSEKVLPAIDNLLQKNGISIGEIDIVSVVVGPGSFTGVRIGAALVKGFCVALPHLKVVAVNSLDLMAFDFACFHAPSKNFCAIQNALGGRFFVREYASDATPLGQAKLVCELPTETKVGLKPEALSEADVFVDCAPTTLLQYSLALIEANAFVDAKTFAPVYLRLSQAEENLQKKEENAEN
ncbi:MAG: tRNA (adenosine(37)-N6)-threonylcarbamoyltransferase complex dimerization subunit type 1 TsaB [Clostridia bacterium]|nr:tRNA (adenosine(37)-N6)-threonylcarbamoyltransferase complex dimerization subunit type 1 TsaB [Clostridia bacterium]